MLETGIKGKKEIIVTEDKTAKAMGSGTLDVFATPAMIALMENTAYESVAAELEPGSGTVGTASATGPATGATGSSTTGLFSTSSVIVIFLIDYFDLMII